LMPQSIRYFNRNLPASANFHQHRQSDFKHQSAISYAYVDLVPPSIDRSQKQNAGSGA
jgi:hypothetical protein